MGKRGDKPRETPLAAQAFRDYVLMGPARSLDALQRAYQTRTGPVPTRHLSTLKQWSMDHEWQARLRDAVNAETETMLERAAEIDAKSFLRTSELLAERLDMTAPIMLDALVKVRESVRKPPPKGAQQVEHSGTVVHEHRHDLSRLSDDELAQLKALRAKIDAGAVGS